MVIIFKQYANSQQQMYKVICPKCGEETFLFSLITTSCNCKHTFPINTRLFGKFALSRLEYHLHKGTVNANFNN